MGTQLVVLGATLFVIQSFITNHLTVKIGYNFVKHLQENTFAINVNFHLPFTDFYLLPNLWYPSTISVNFHHNIMSCSATFCLNQEKKRIWNIIWSTAESRIIIQEILKRNKKTKHLLKISLGWRYISNLVKRRDISFESTHNKT